MRTVTDMAPRLDLSVTRMDDVWIDFYFEDESGNPVNRPYQAYAYYVEFRDRPGGELVFNPDAYQVPDVPGHIRIQLDSTSTKNLESCFWSLVEQQRFAPYVRTTLLQGRVNVTEGITR